MECGVERVSQDGKYDARLYPHGRDPEPEGEWLVMGAVSE